MHSLLDNNADDAEFDSDTEDDFGDVEEEEGGPDVRRNWLK